MDKVFQYAIDRVTAAFPASGAAFGAVRDGKVIVRDTWGAAELENRTPVTAQTVFDVASESKAFACFLFSQLCDDGLLDWDKPVRTWWQDFHFSDEYVSAHITPRDLASHRSGLTSHGLMRRQPDIQSIKEAAERAQFLAPCCGFREEFHYQNELYAVLGYLCERVTGKSYQELIRERICKPIGMELIFRSEAPRDDWQYAEPYVLRRTELQHTARDFCKYNDPCGGVRANLENMLKWLTLLTRGGVAPDGTRLLSEKLFRNLYYPNSFWTMGGGRDRMRSYGLGLAPSVFRGELLAYHGGSLGGFKTQLGFFPELGCGYFATINSDTMPLLYVLKNILADTVLERREDSYDAIIDARIEKFAKENEARPAVKPTVLPLTEAQKKNFCGEYYNGAYHNSTISLNDDGGLAVTCGIDTADIYQTAENVFRGRFRVCRIGADCVFDPDGQRVRMSFCDTFSPDEFVKLK